MKMGEKGYIVENLNPHLIKVIYENGNCKIHCIVRDCKDKVKLKVLRIPQNFNQDYLYKNKELSQKILQLQKCLEIKNKELDSLHYVWCSGGCSGGVNRYNNSELNEEIVKRAEYNIYRLRTWFENYKFIKLTNKQKIKWFYKFCIKRLLRIFVDILDKIEHKIKY